MERDALTLDGNAAAGLLGELFAVEMTAARVTCDTCGTEGEVGGARVYGGVMGAILRCAVCDAVVIRLVRTPRGLTFDARGMRCLVVAATAE
jgi:hypothetical protein